LSEIAEGFWRAPETFLTASFFTVEARARTGGRASAWVPRLSTRNAQRRNGQSILRRTMSGAAGNGLGASIEYLRRTTSGTAGNGLSRCQGIPMCPFTISALHSRYLVRSSFANKQNSAFLLVFTKICTRTYVTFFFGGSLKYRPISCKPGPPSSPSLRLKEPLAPPAPLAPPQPSKSLTGFLAQPRPPGATQHDLIGKLLPSGFSSVVLPIFGSTTDKSRQLYPPRLASQHQSPSKLLAPCCAPRSLLSGARTCNTNE
jgi:hypothetical protein